VKGPQSPALAVKHVERREQPISWKNRDPTRLIADKEKPEANILILQHYAFENKWAIPQGTIDFTVTNPERG
jgi:hypothetical protein